MERIRNFIILQKKIRKDIIFHEKLNNRGDIKSPLLFFVAIQVDIVSSMGFELSLYGLV